jgi:hypothetical protein
MPSLDRIQKIWPKSTPPADPKQFLDEAQRIIDEAKQGYESAKKSIEAPIEEVLLQDMPESCLDGRLGEMFSRRMSRFPVAYGYLALVTAASVLVPHCVESTRANLFTALVGAIHTGKSQAIETAQALLGISAPQLLEVMAGSAEGLIRKCQDAAGNRRLFSPDELGHLFAKAQIQNASFSYVLCRAFYADKFEVLMGRGQAATFHASLSILGGLIDGDKFEEAFGVASMAGLYDRFLFGACPGGFVFEYVPFDGVSESTEPSSVSIHPDVWAQKAEWRAEDPELEPRVAELALRVAVVCASFDGRKQLTARDLGPAREMARYQTRIRRMLKPNPGENFEGKIAYKILDYLSRYGGKFVSKREMLRATHAYRYGPSVAERALSVLHANGDVDIQKIGREVLVRLVPERRDETIVETEQES